MDAVGIIFWVFFHRSWFLGLGFLSWVALLISRLVHFITHRSKTLPLLLVFALLDLPIEIALISLSGENYDHYFFTILPCMAILIAFGWTQLQRVKWFKLPPFQWAVYLLLALTLIVSPIKQVIDAYRQPIDQTTTATIEYIRKSTLETDYVLLWGSQTMINFVSGRDSPTRFVHQKGLFRSGYASPQISAEMLNDLSTKKPVLIIDSHLPSTPFLTMTANGQCIMPDTVLPQGIPEVFQYICNHYDLVGEVGGKDHWQVYKLR